MSSSPLRPGNTNTDINNVVGIISTDNGEEKEYKGMGALPVLGKELDLNTFMQQQWNHVYNGLNQQNAEEIDDSGCPPLSQAQAFLTGNTTDRSNYDTAAMQFYSTIVPMPTAMQGNSNYTWQWKYNTVSITKLPKTKTRTRTEQ